MPAWLNMREGWLSFFLLLMLILTVTISLQAAQWAPGLQILLGVALAAFPLGFLFAKSERSGFLLHPISLLLGTGWIAFLSRQLVEKGPWDEQLAEVGLRLSLWANELVQGGVSQDTLPFVLLMAALIWLVAYGAAWDFYRAHNIWGVLLPGGITITINTYYARENLSFLFLFFLVLAFLLVIRSNLLDKEEQWQNRNVSYSPDIHFDFMREGAVFAILVISLAWFLPSLIQTSHANPLFARLNEPWTRAQQEWTRAFSALNYQGTAAAGTSFGRSMAFSGPLQRTNRPVMRVKAAKGRYWRGVVLDKYTSCCWIVSDQEVAEGPNAEEPIKLDVGRGREVMEQEFTMQTSPGAQLFVAGTPFEVNLDTRLVLGGPTSEGEQVTANNLAQLYAHKRLQANQSYTVLSAISVADEQSLREAGTDYPDWLLEHYTQLPSAVPERVHDLAAKVTADADTPFDAAKTLERYLRTSFPYNENISGPKPGEDAADYFLFREQQGYCDYYANAMAVMLRSLGIPARIAQGYTPGTQVESGVYEVTQLNAHTWVEVYFPEYGWIEFEPTAAEPQLLRPLAPPESYEDDALPVPEQRPLTDVPKGSDLSPEERAEAAGGTDPAFGAGSTITFDYRLLALPLGAFGFAGVFGLAGWALMQRRWRSLGIIEQIYDQVVWVGRLLGRRIDPSLTPEEYAEQVGTQVPEARSPLARLAALFSKARFSKSGLAGKEEHEAKTLWVGARRALVRGIARRFSGRLRFSKEERSEEDRDR